VTPKPLALDTPPDVERLQVERWRQMSPAAKAEIVTGLTQAAHDLARSQGSVTAIPTRRLGSSFSASPFSCWAASLRARHIRTPPHSTGGNRGRRSDIGRPDGHADPGSVRIVHTIGGSIAASFAGEPRSSIDIDIVVALDGSAVPDLVAALASDFYVAEAQVVPKRS
jgi:hypothetical protein